MYIRIFFAAFSLTSHLLCAADEPAKRQRTARSSENTALGEVRSFSEIAHAYQLEKHAAEHRATCASKSNLSEFLVTVTKKFFETHVLESNLYQDAPKSMPQIIEECRACDEYAQARCPKCVRSKIKEQIRITKK